MKNLTFKEKHILENKERPSVVFFTSDGCHLCVELKPKLEKLSREFSSHFDFYKVNINKEKKLADNFLKKEEGVPTGFIISGERVFKIKDPDEPDKKSWYSEEYLKKLLDLIK